MPQLNFTEWPTWLLAILIIINIFKAPLGSLLSSLADGRKRDEDRMDKSQEEVVDMLKSQLIFNNNLFVELKQSIDINTSAMKELIAEIRKHYHQEHS